MQARGASYRGGDTMTIHIPTIRITTMRTCGAFASIAFAAMAIALQARAGADKITFPENYASGVLYATFDKADNKQVHEFYASQAAIDAAKAGQPLPSGTAIIGLHYAAQLDAQGNPVKDANGRFIKANLVNYAVMEKRTGWGSDYPDNVRNGEWEYQVFKADKTPNTAANLSTCFGCHKPIDKQDYVYSYDRLKAVAK
jgi:Cytochrome P460